MSIRTSVSGFLDKLTDAYFKRDGDGRLIFFPMGFGYGRIVPNADVEATLRLGCRRLMIALFAVVIPVLAMISGVYPFMGLKFLLYFAGCLVLGFALQLYPLWLSRNLERAAERLSYSRAVSGNLDRFGKRFQIFGLVTSAVMATASGLALAYPPLRAHADVIASALACLTFSVLTVVYAMALRRRRMPALTE